MADVAPDRASQIVAHPRREYWKLAVPVMFFNAISALTFVVDGVFVARLGDAPFRALTYATPVMLFVASFNMCINMTMVRTLGFAAAAAARPSDPVFLKQLHSGLFLAAATGVVLILVGLPLAPTILRLLGATGSDVTHGAVYLRLVALSAVVSFGMSTVYAATLAFGRTRSASIAAACSIVSNVVLDPICIFVLELGIAGAVVATIASQLVGTAVLVASFRDESTAMWKPDWSSLVITREVREGLRGAGLPALLDAFMYSAWSFVMMRTVSSFGAPAVEGYGAGLQIRHPVITALQGLSYALTTVNSNLDGAQRRDLVSKVVSNAVGAGAILAFGCSLLLFGLSSWLVPQFVDGVDSVRFAEKFLFYALFCNMFLTTATMATRSLQGLGRGSIATGWMAFRNIAALLALESMRRTGLLGFAELLAISASADAILTATNMFTLRGLLRRHRIPSATA